MKTGWILLSEGAWDQAASLAWLSPGLHFLQSDIHNIVELWLSTLNQQGARLESSKWNLVKRKTIYCHKIQWSLKIASSGTCCSSQTNSKSFLPSEPFYGVPHFPLWYLSEQRNITESRLCRLTKKKLCSCSNISNLQMTCKIEICMTLNIGKPKQNKPTDQETWGFLITHMRTSQGTAKNRTRLRKSTLKWHNLACNRRSESWTHLPLERLSSSGTTRPTKWQRISELGNTGRNTHQAFSDG